MKKLFTIVATVTLVCVVIPSCKKLITKIFQGIDAPVPTIEITLPPIVFAPPYELPLGTFTQPFNLDSTIRANTDGAFNAQDVKSVKVKKIDFNISNADQNNNLSNFESARFTLSSNAQSSPIEIASTTFPNTFATGITYTSPETAPELRPYLDGSALTYNVFGKARRTTSKPLDLVILVTLTIK